jgi:HSP20 family protein
MTKKGKQGEKSSHGEAAFSLGGILKGLTDLVEKLDDLAENDGELSKTGEILGKNQQVKGIYGVTVKVGLGDDKPRVEPFGNIHKDTRSGNTVVQEVREPVVDVFEEKDHVLVVAEMPGIGAKDIHLEIDGDLLTLSAAKGDKKYRKEVQLPESFSRDKAEVSCNNGVVEIKCRRSH